MNVVVVVFPNTYSPAYILHTTAKHQGYEREAILVCAPHIILRQSFSPGSAPLQQPKQSYIETWKEHMYNDQWRFVELKLSVR